MLLPGEVRGLGQELPAEHLRGFGGTVGAVMLDWPFGSDFGKQYHLERLDADFRFLEREDQLP